MKIEAQVVMRLKIQEQSELDFVSRIIQSRYIGIGNYPTCEAMRDYIVSQFIPRRRDCGTATSNTVDVISEENLPGQYL